MATTCMWKRCKAFLIQMVTIGHHVNIYKNQAQNICHDISPET